MGAFIRKYIKMLVEHEIVRRYIIINSFDGALTVLGIVFIEFISGISEPEMVFLPCIGAAIAMLVSGIWGAYFAERAETKKDIRALESHLLRNLEKSLFARNKKRLAVISSLTFGLSPFMTALIITVPFFFASAGAISIDLAYYFSFGLVAAVLFILGVFAGRIGRENIIKQGLLMVLAGFAIGFIFLLLAWMGVL